MYNLSGYNIRLASVPKQYDHIKVVVGSEEKIYDKTYLTAIIQGRRLVKVLKESIKYE